MVGVNLTQLAKIERQLASMAQAKTSRLKPIPERWEEFVSLIQIRTANGYGSFEAYDYQIKFSDLVDRCTETVCIKTRQTGLSTLAISKCLHWAIKTPGFTALVFSRGQKESSALAARTRQMLESLEDYTTTVSDSLTRIELINGSTIHFLNASVNASRGYDSVHCLIFDEFTFVPDLEQIVTSAYPTTSMLGDKARIIYISTPNLQSGFAFDKINSNNPEDRDVLTQCELIREGKIPSQFWVDNQGNGKALIHFKDHPIYGSKPNYLETVASKSGLPFDKVQQEYNLSFSSSEEMVFNPALVTSVCSGKLTKSPGKRQVFIGVDPNASSGNKSDYFAASVLAYNAAEETVELIDYMRVRGQTLEYSIYQLLDICKKYKPAKVLLESNNSGNFVSEQMIRGDSSLPLEMFNTNQKSKDVIISRLTWAMEKSAIKLPDDRVLVQEFLSFARQGNKLGAISGKHDDLLMSLAIALEASPLSDTPNPNLISISFSED